MSKFKFGDKVIVELEAPDSTPFEGVVISKLKREVYAYYCVMTPDGDSLRIPSAQLTLVEEDTQPTIPLSMVYDEFKILNDEQSSIEYKCIDDYDDYLEVSMSKFEGQSDRDTVFLLKNTVDGTHRHITLSRASAEHLALTILTNLIATEGGVDVS